MNQLLGPNQEAWLKELESGNYPQTTHGFLSDNHGYCCLGVGCRTLGLAPNRTNVDTTYTLFHDEFDGQSELAPQSLIDWLALYDSSGDIAPEKIFCTIIGFEGIDSLVDANDSEYSFELIAKFCRANPSAVFRESK